MSTASTFVIWMAMAIGNVPPEGAIHGVVHNLSTGNRPIAAVEVELRAELDGEMVPVARTTSDLQGRFVFRGVPLDQPLTYVACANLEGIQYPGPRMTLGPGRPSAHVRLAVREAISQSSPLVIREQQIIIEPEMGVLHVTEALLIDNPTELTYVGRNHGKSEMPATFTLGIPANFERLTFEEERFGRQFALVNGKVVTTMPWEPGKRWLRFTYTMRSEQSSRRWERRIDAPCAKVELRVFHDQTDSLSSSLPAIESDNANARSFESSGHEFAPGDVVWVEMGMLPVSWSVYARWTAAGLLAATIVSLSLWNWRRRTVGRRHAPTERQRMGSGPPSRKRAA